METLGSRLKKLREKLGWSQKEAAKKFGITNFQLSRYESDISNPDPDLIAKFAIEYDVSTDYLLGVNNKKYNIEYDPEFEKWVNDPRSKILFKEFNESSEEQKEALLKMWEILKSQGKL